MLPAGAAEGQLPAGIAGAKEKTNQGGWFYFTLEVRDAVSGRVPKLLSESAILLV